MFKFAQPRLLPLPWRYVASVLALDRIFLRRIRKPCGKSRYPISNAPENTSKKEGHKYDTKAGGPSEKERKTMRDETMGKKTMSKEMTGKEKQ